MTLCDSIAEELDIVEARVVLRDVRGGEVIAQCRIQHWHTVGEFFIKTFLPL